MFFKMKEINPFPIADTIRFRNVDKTITLSVKSGASAMVLNIRRTQEKLSALKDDSTDEERLAAAQAFAETIFGADQAEKLVEFYDKDPLVIITVCSEYFNKRLAKIINKAQKK